MIFIPAGDPWQKGSTVRANAVERAGMVSRAIRSDPRFEISMREVDRQGPTFTIDTVREFQRENPGEEFLLMIGSDAFNGIRTWREYDELLKLVDLVVAIRPGQSLEEIPGAQVRIIKSEMFDISSTQIRQAVRSGAELSAFVPEAIIEDVRRIYGA